MAATVATLAGYGMWWLAHRTPASLDGVKDFFTITGAAAAGLYFAIRFVGGEFWTGASFTVSLERKKNLLAISARMSNQRSTSLIVYSATALVRGTSGVFRVPLGDGFHIHETIDTQMLSMAGVQKPAIVSAASNAQHTFDLSDFLVNPDDEVTFVGIAEVPATDVVIVDVVIVGRAYFGFIEIQWISSAVALPV